MPVLRAQGAGRAAEAAARSRARRADGNRRRLRRQGRIPVDARVPRRDPRAQGRPAGEDDLRPRRGSAGDDQAASVDRAPSHRADARRPHHRDGHRRGDGRRRLRDAERGGAVARRDSRRRSVSLRSRAHSRPRDDDAHAAQRRVPRLRRAADAVRRSKRTWIASPTQLGIDPVRLREINALRPGDTTATGQKLGKDASALPVLREAVKRSQFHAEAQASGRAPIAASACRCSSTAPASPAAARSSSRRKRRSS